MTTEVKLQSNNSTFFQLTFSKSSNAVHRFAPVPPFPVLEPGDMPAILLVLTKTEEERGGEPWTDCQFHASCKKGNAKATAVFLRVH